MTMLYLGAAEIAALLPMAECIEVMERTLRALARGEGVQPLRSVVRLSGVAPPGGLLGLMPGQIGDAGGIAGIKVVTLFPGNRLRGEETHLGAVLLFDTEVGRPLAHLDAAAVTAIRTAAVSAVATRALARQEAGDLALLGAGVQARTHLEALAAVRRLRRVRVWSRRPESARRFAEAEGALHGVAIEAMESAAAAVEGADLVCTVSAAREPVLAGARLAAGAHVNAVGACVPAARELDSAAVRRARLFVDRRESALHESGDFLVPLREGVIGEDHIAGELGDVLEGRVAGRRAAGSGEITLFKSLGLAVEDLAASLHVYRRAVEQGRGVRLEG